MISPHPLFLLIFFSLSLSFSLPLFLSPSHSHSYSPESHEFILTPPINFSPTLQGSFLFLSFSVCYPLFLPWKTWLPSSSIYWPICSCQEYTDNCFRTAKPYCWENTYSILCWVKTLQFRMLKWFSLETRKQQSRDCPSILLMPSSMPFPPFLFFFKTWNKIMTLNILSLLIIQQPHTFQTVFKVSETSGSIDVASFDWRIFSFFYTFHEANTETQKQL